MLGKSTPNLADVEPTTSVVSSGPNYRPVDHPPECRLPLPSSHSQQPIAPSQSHYPRHQFAAHPGPLTDADLEPDAVTAIVARHARNDGYRAAAHGGVPQTWIAALRSQ